MSGIVSNVIVEKPKHWCDAYVSKDACDHQNLRMKRIHISFTINWSKVHNSNTKVFAYHISNAGFEIPIKENKELHKQRCSLRFMLYSEFFRTILRAPRYSISFYWNLLIIVFHSTEFIHRYLTTIEFFTWESFKTYFIGKCMTLTQILVRKHHVLSTHLYHLGCNYLC